LSRISRYAAKQSAAVSAHVHTADMPAMPAVVSASQGGIVVPFAAPKSASSPSSMAKPRGAAASVLAVLLVWIGLLVTPLWICAIAWTVWQLF
jgi:hypothetical protein